jgi:DNA anti-recombination protein RmuC
LNHLSSILPSSAFIFFASLALLFVPFGCGVRQQQQQRKQTSIPETAQATIDNVTANIEAARDELIYREAAEEWRRNATPEQTRAIFETLRAKLGPVKERARQSVHEEQKTAGEMAGHRLVIRYETRFERGQGMETFTLVERDGGRWLLAGYLVNSDALAGK